MAETTIRVQTLSGNWETLGTDRSAGVWAEDVSLTSNRWGPDTASFRLKRLPGALNPDLRAFTPVEIEVGGVLVWDGFVWETPSTPLGVTANCRGYQYHLDDNTYQPRYIHTSLSEDWSDLRDWLRTGMLYASNVGVASGNVEIGQSALRFGWNKGENFSSGQPTWCGVVCDLSKWNLDDNGRGGARARRIYLRYETANVGGLSFYARAIYAPSTGDPYSAAGWASGSTYTDLAGAAGVALTTLGASGTIVDNIDTRNGAYLQLFVYLNPAGDGVFGADEWVRITECKIASNPTHYGGRVAYLGRNKSLVRASDVVKDAVRQTSPLISVPSSADLSATSYREEVYADNPLAYFPMSEASGATISGLSSEDESTLPTATLSGGYTRNQPGAILDGNTDASTLFNGSTASGITGSLAHKSQFAMEAWFNVAGGAGTFRTVIRSNSNGHIMRVNTANNIECYLWDGTAYQVISNTVPATIGSWYHVVVVHDSGSYWVIVNGAQVATGAITAKPAVTTTNYIGDSPVASEKFNGYIGHVAFYNYRFSLQQAVNHYNCGRARPIGSKVQRTTFPIPDFWRHEQMTAREVITAVNSFHDFQASVPPGRELAYRKLPTSPLLTVNSGDDGVEFEDTSANAGEDVYSRVIVTGEDFDGRSIQRQIFPYTTFDNTGFPTAYGGNGRPQTSRVTIPNPSAEVDASNWSATGTGSSVVRTTTGGEFDSGAGGLRWTITDATTSLKYLTSPFSGVFVPGVNYSVRIKIRHNQGVNRSLSLFVRDREGNYQLASSKTVATGASFTFWEGSLSFNNGFYAPAIGADGSVFRFEYQDASACIWYIDSIEILETPKNLVAQRGFVRTKILPISSPITYAGAAMLGKAYIDAHASVPFRGSLGISGQGSVKRSAGGQGVHPANLLLATGELIRVADVLDQDTGGLGRDGRIDSVTYDCSTERAQITLDSQRERFEALAARYSAVAG